ncbi:MAG: cytochrome c3 family protein [Clostridia bacterium]|nr:cytochrome c3 family protein [Clostridia bacterium]
MAKKILLLVTLVMLVTLMPTPTWASTSSKQVQVDHTPNGTDANATDVRVKWLFAAGDVIEKSVDGQTWQVVSTVTDGEAVITGVPNWSVLYFRIRDSANNLTPFAVFPPNQNAHDTYLTNTELCAGCHSTHTGEGAKLIKKSSIKELCRSCHGYLNTGSRYNTDNGAVLAAGTKDPDTGLVTAITWEKSLAGPFFSNDLEVWGAGATVTSNHTIEGPDGTIPPAGTGPLSPVPGGDSSCNRCHDLTCTSCHLVHGGNGTYRNLDPYYATVTAYAYNATGNAVEKPKYISGMTQFCGFCHNVVLKPEGSATTLTGTLDPYHGFWGTYPESKYRHATGVDLTYTGPDAVPVTVNPTIYPTEGSPPTVSCITCHFAHGTVSPASYQTSFPTRGTSGSMLLRSKSTSICMDCHPK